MEANKHTTEVCCEIIYSALLVLHYELLTLLAAS